MDIKGYDDWKLKPYEEEPKFVTTCDHCNEDIYEGDEVVTTVDDEHVHTDCFDEFARTLLIKFCGPMEAE